MPPATATPATPATEPLLQVLPLDQLAPHPDNVRRHLGDITELAKSITGSGILEPLLVLPAGDDGLHLVVAGHRRLAGARKAGLDTAPCIVRHLTEAEVIEAMLVENLQRAEISPVEEARAYARLVELETKVADIARKVGRSQPHVKARLDLLALPDKVLGWVEDRDLTLAAAAELAEVMADPAATEWLDQQPAPGSNMVARLTAALREAARTAALEAERAKLDKAGIAEFTPKSAYWMAPYRFSADPMPVSMLELGKAGSKHRLEPCHAVRLQAMLDDDGAWSVDRQTICTAPLRHTTLTPLDDRSELQADPARYAHLDPNSDERTRADAERAANRAADAEHCQLVADRQRFAMDAWSAGKLPRLDPMVASLLVAEMSAAGIESDVWELLYPDIEADHAGQVYDDIAAALTDPTATDRWAWAFIITTAESYRVGADSKGRWYAPVRSGWARWLRFHESLGRALHPTEQEWLAVYDANPTDRVQVTADEDPVDVDELGLSDELTELLAGPAGAAGEVILPAASELLADLQARGWADADPARDEGPGLVVARFTPAGTRVAVAVAASTEGAGE